MLAALASRVDETQHPFLTEREVKTRGILLVTTNIGLCGALNANLFKHVLDIKTPAKFVAIGRKGAQFLARSKRDLNSEFTVGDRGSFKEVKVAIEHMTKLYLDGEVDTIEVIYPRFKNTLIQEATVRPVLPLANLKGFIAHLQAESGTENNPQNDTREIIFEPNAHDVLAALLPYYVNRHIHQLVLSAKASEFSARMVAMKTANDNASSLIEDLTLEYNKARQAAITQEILEISAGQSAA
jgi:F-type H+-transporting ATPase subunit gamma